MIDVLCERIHKVRQGTLVLLRVERRSVAFHPQAQLHKVVPGVAVAGFQHYTYAHPAQTYQRNKHGTFEIGLAQPGDGIANGLAAGPHLLQALLRGGISRALAKLDLIPGVLLGLAAQHLLAERDIEPTPDSGGNHIQVEIGQVIGHVGKSPVLAMLARPVAWSQSSQQFIKALPEAFEVGEERGSCCWCKSPKSCHSFLPIGSGLCPSHMVVSHATSIEPVGFCPPSPAALHSTILTEERQNGHAQPPSPPEKDWPPNYVQITPWWVSGKRRRSLP